MSCQKRQVYKTAMEESGITKYHARPLNSGFALILSRTPPPTRSSITPPRFGVGTFQNISMIHGVGPRLRGREREQAGRFRTQFYLEEGQSTAGKHDIHIDDSERDLSRHGQSLRVSARHECLVMSEKGRKTETPTPSEPRAVTVKRNEPARDIPIQNPRI